MRAIILVVVSVVVVGSAIGGLSVTSQGSSPAPSPDSAWTQTWAQYQKLAGQPTEAELTAMVELIGKLVWWKTSCDDPSLDPLCATISDRQYELWLRCGTLIYYRYGDRCPAAMATESELERRLRRLRDTP